MNNEYNTRSIQYYVLEYDGQEDRGGAIRYLIEKRECT